MNTPSLPVDIYNKEALINIHKEIGGYLIYRLDCTCKLPYSPYIGMTGAPSIRFDQHEHAHQHEDSTPYLSLLGWSSSRDTACLIEDLFADILSNRQTMMRCRSCGMINGQGRTCTRCQLGWESV